MPTTTDRVPDTMRPLFDSVRLGQDLWLGAARAWLEFGQGTWPAFFPAPSGNHSVSPAEMIDLSFGYVRTLLDAQEDYARTMLDRAALMQPWPQLESRSR